MVQVRWTVLSYRLALEEMAERAAQRTHTVSDETWADQNAVQLKLMGREFMVTLKE